LLTPSRSRSLRRKSRFPNRPPLSPRKHGSSGKTMDVYNSRNSLGKLQGAL
jgi:hypothetical protein